ITGKQVRQFLGHEGGVESVAFSPRGGTLASGSMDHTVLIWNVTGRLQGRHLHPADLSPQALNGLWADLAGSDVQKADDAVWTLTAAPKQAVPFLWRRLKPVPRVDPKWVVQLIHRLRSEKFTERKQATEELEKLGEIVEQALLQALTAHPELEV